MSLNMRFVLLVFLVLKGFVLTAEFNIPEPQPICVEPYWVYAAKQSDGINPDFIGFAFYQHGRAEIGMLYSDEIGGLADCRVYSEPGPFEFSPTNGVVFGDFNEDGKIDIIAVDSSRNPTDIGIYGPSRLVAFLSTGESFQLVDIGLVERRNPYFPLATGDVDEDGHLDLVFGSSVGLHWDQGRR